MKTFGTRGVRGLAVLLACAAFARAAPSGKIAVDVDPRIELAGWTQWLSPAAGDPKGFIRPVIPYTREIERFSSSAGFPSPDADPSLKSFIYSDRCQALLRLSPLPELVERLPMPYALYDRAGGRERFEAWLRSQRDFSRDARFPDEFASAKRLLDPQVSAFRREIEKVGYLGEIEAYTGLPLIGEYSIFLSPFVGNGDNANVVEALDDGSIEITSVFGPRIVPDSGIDFWSVRTPGTLWHEAGHGIEDPLADLFSGEIAASSAAYRASWGCYGDWPQCVKEQVVRAVMIRLVAAEFGEKTAAEQLAFEDEGRFPFLKAMIESLKTYERSRKLYPTLADYYPRLLEVLPSPGARPRPVDFSSLARQLDCAPPAKTNRLKRYLEQLLARARDPELLAAARRAHEAAAAADAPGSGTGPRCR